MDVSIEPATAGAASPAELIVRQFRQILLWPLQLIPLKAGAQIHKYWELLESFQNEDGPVWRELTDEFPDDAAALTERHYREFVTFLPRAQRFLYGERTSRTGRTGYGESPIRIYRRQDIRAVRVVLRPGDAPIELAVAHADLYFFFDVDIVILVFELSCSDLPLASAQEFVHRFGRAYPAGWTEAGEAEKCPARVEWLDAGGQVLAVSDFASRLKFIASVCRHTAPAIAEHWEFLLQPMCPHHGERTGPLRFRQLEYYRMPSMVYLAVDDPCALAQADCVRFALSAASKEHAGLPYSQSYLRDFEHHYAYDRYHDPGRGGECADTRILCTGHNFVAVGDAHQTAYTDPERGFLSQFRHQIFLLGLIAHFHRAAMLMVSDRLMTIISRLDISDIASVREFRREIRQTQEIFLRFTHRYWFSEVSDQPMAHDLFHMWSHNLSLNKLHADLREELQDMLNYLDSDMMRRQSTAIVRLTVVTVMSILGTVTTGVLGMNVFDEAAKPWHYRLSLVALALIGTIFITYIVLRRSQPLAHFFETVADTRVTLRRQLNALRAVFWERR